MDFDFTDEQIMFRNMAREFAERFAKPIARDIDRESRFPLELIKELAPLGLLGMVMPQKYGGLDVGHVAYCLVLEELAKVSFTIASIAATQNSLSGAPILEWGNEEQKQKYLIQLISGECIGCLGVTEPNHGSDPASMETSAVLDGQHWVINGSKTFVSGGSVAGLAVSAAQTDKSKKHRGLIAFVVEQGTPGFSTKDIQGKLGWRGYPISQLIFQDCRVPVENLLGQAGDGLKVLMSGMDDTRLVVSACSVGICQGCIDACINYAQERQQFGKPIGSFQLIQAMIADMLVETEAARLLTYKAATLMDQGLRGRVETSFCKLFASELAQRVTTNALQVHGGYGYIDEYPLERFMRDARSLTIIEGTSQIHRLIIGQRFLGISAFS